MTADAVHLRRPPWPRAVVAIVAIVAVLAGGCGSGRAHTAAGVGSPAASTAGTRGAVVSSTSTPTVTAQTQPNGGAHSTGRTPTSSAGTGATVGPGVSSPGRPPTDAIPTPLSPGTYRYDTNGQSSVSGGATGTARYPPVTTLVADVPQGGRQHSTRDLRDAHGNGTVIETTEVFEPDGVHLADIKTTTTSAGISQDQEFQPSPAPLLLPTGAHAGAHIQFTMSNSTVTAKVTIDVVGTQQLVIGGTVVDTLAVHTVNDLSGEVTGRTTSDASVTPEHDLTVKEHVVADGQIGLNSFHTDYTATLQRLSAS